MHGVWFWKVFARMGIRKCGVMSQAQSSPTGGLEFFVCHDHPSHLANTPPPPYRYEMLQIVLVMNTLFPSWDRGCKPTAPSPNEKKGGMANGRSSCAPYRAEEMTAERPGSPAPAFSWEKHGSPLCLRHAQCGYASLVQTGVQVCVPF